MWDLESFKSSDLRTYASHKQQKVGEPLVVGRCELPADGVINFPLKKHYDSVNLDIFNPLLIDRDPEEGDESDEEAIAARAPPDLDARVPLELPPIGGMDTPLAPEPPHKVIVDEPHDLEADVASPKEAEETKVTNALWLEAFSAWSKKVSSEEVKRKVVTLMMAPDVKGFTTR